MEIIDKNEWWRKRLRQSMYQYGYDQDEARSVVEELQTETDGAIILSQLAVVVACGK